MKKKLLVWCDFLVPTGFGNVAKNLLDTMHEEYDVSVIGINYLGNKRYDFNKYFVYAVTRDDMLGAKLLIETVEKEKPDLIFLFQDIFHIHELIGHLKEKSPNSKIVSYFPIDGYPFAKVWENAIALSDAVITYTDWAISLIQETLPNNTKKIYKLYHGVDTKTFYPMSQPLIAELRKKHKLQDKFVVINVNRYQPRKAIPLSVRIMSMFIKGYHKCSCGAVYPKSFGRCDVNGCGPEKRVKSVLTEKTDVYYYLHMMNYEFSMGMQKTNSLQHIALNSGFSELDAGKTIGINARDIYSGNVPESELNEFYNFANLNISTAIGEGAGLSLLESQAAGTRSIAPLNSAIPEQLNGTGVLVRNTASYVHQLDNGHWRPHVDCEAFVEALEAEYKEFKKQPAKIPNKACIRNIHQNFLWDDKVALLKSIFAEVLK